MTEAQKRYEKKRMKECKNYTVKYRLYIDTEKTDQKRLQTYLNATGQSANTYLKNLIRRDLDSKGIEYTVIDDRTDISAEKIPEEVETEDTEG